jgi:dihydropteroate synthase
MLSLGGDAAVARGSLTGKQKKTDCLLIGNLSQFNCLEQKLKTQPFGLKNIASGLSRVLNNYQKQDFTLELPRFRMHLQRDRAYIMGIINLTPDSFSGDGLYPSLVVRRPSSVVRRPYFVVRRSLAPSAVEGSSVVIDYAQKMVADGADIIDVGGESSRPGAKRVSAKEEISRVIPAIKILAKKIKVPISIDTYKPEVARAALDNGAVIVNDITGLKNPRMAKLIAGFKAGVVIMHMRGLPRTMQKNPQYHSLIDEIIKFLEEAIKRAQDAGIRKERIIIDPGLGFGKTAEHNLEILNKLREFKALGRPVLIGPSRKSFIGKILNTAPQERIFGTVAASVLAAHNGAKVLRVHDVKEARQALSVYENITGQEYGKH